MRNNKNARRPSCEQQAKPHEEERYSHFTNHQEIFNILFVWGDRSCCWGNIAEQGTSDRDRGGCFGGMKVLNLVGRAKEKCGFSSLDGWKLPLSGEDGNASCSSRRRTWVWITRESGFWA
jgi:hypothetical protein